MVPEKPHEDVTIKVIIKVSLETYPLYSFIMKQVCVLEVRSLGSRLNGGPSLIFFFRETSHISKM